MWKNNYQERMRSVEDVVAMIHSGDCVFVSASLSIPYNVLNVLSDRYQELKDVKIVGCHAQKPIKFFTDPKYQGHFEFHSFSLVH